MSFTLQEIDVATDGTGAGTADIEFVGPGRLVDVAFDIPGGQPVGMSTALAEVGPGGTRTLLTWSGNASLPLRTPVEAPVTNVGATQAGWFVLPAISGPLTVTVAGGGASLSPSVHAVVILER